jgi:thioredoxin 1
MSVEMLNDRKLKDVVKDGFSIVDFIMEKCGYCVILSKALDILSYEVPSLKIVKVHKDLNKEEISNFAIEGFPTVYFYKDGEKVDEIVGALPIEEFYPIIKKYLY